MKKRHNLLLNAIVFVAVTAAQCQLHDPQHSISITVTGVPDTVKSGSEITGSVNLTNISDHDIFVIQDLSRQGEFHYHLDVHSTDGGSVHKTKYYRGVIGEEPGER